MELDLATQLVTIVAVTSSLAALGGFVYDILFPVGVVTEERPRLDNQISLPHRVEGGIDLGFLGPVLVGVVAGNAAIFAVAFRTETDGSALVGLPTLIWIALVAGVAGAALLDALRDRLIARVEGRDEKEGSRSGVPLLVAPALKDQLASRFPELAREVCEGVRSAEEGAAELEKDLLAVLAGVSSGSDPRRPQKRRFLRYVTAAILVAILIITVAMADVPEGKTGGGDLIGLTLRTKGSGLVRIRPGVTCPPTCSFDAEEGAKLRLVAVPSQGFRFAGWSEGCSDAPRCIVEMNEDTSLTARFRKSGPAAMVPLTISVQGEGLVTMGAVGVECPPTCSYDARRGEGLSLSAIPAEGFVFSGWSGGCAGTGGCELSMDDATSVTARFEERPAATVQLTISPAGRGAGSVEVGPAGVMCPPTCVLDVPKGEGLTLTAIPAEGSFFEGWTGSCTGSDPCLLPMTQRTEVEATFHFIAD
ncbi:MAG: hypothetical protein GEU78_02465 [Actinobacteria bacterium]|nr:hypothetical protein [Actinomycetota bacterium]